MSYNRCSGNFPSGSSGGRLQYGSSCGSSYPSNLASSTNVCSPGAYQLGSSLYSGCADTCREPARLQRSYMVSSPCQASCYRPGITTLCSPCQTTYSGSLGLGLSTCRTLGCGSRSCSSLGYGSRSMCSSCYGPSDYRSLSYGAHTFPTRGYRSSFCNPTLFSL